MYRNFFKRIIDLTGALIALILLSPVFLFFGFWFLIVNKGSVFFRQDRPGLHGKIFRIYKFKTMNDQKDNTGKLLPDNDRLTLPGRIARNWSVDELPQLFNILKGEMSLIGPRPLLVRYLPLYTPEQARRHEVRPGITGWAQVNGRNSITWEEKFHLDLFYVINCSFFLDCYIFFLTFKKVMVKEGINQSPGRPMDPFQGSKK